MKNEVLRDILLVATILVVFIIGFFILPLMRFELMASPLPRECATPAPQGLALA